MENQKKRSNCVFVMYICGGESDIKGKCIDNDDSDNNDNENNNG